MPFFRAEQREFVPSEAHLYTGGVASGLVGAGV